MSRVTSFKEVVFGMPDSNRQPPVPRLELYPIELIPCTGRVHTNRSIHTVRWVALVRRAGFREPAPQERRTPPSLSVGEATILAHCATPASGRRRNFRLRKKNPDRRADQGSFAWKASQCCLPGSLWKLNTLPARRSQRGDERIGKTESTAAPPSRGRCRNGKAGIRSAFCSLSSVSPGFPLERQLQIRGRGSLGTVGRMSTTFFGKSKTISECGK